MYSPNHDVFKFDNGPYRTMLSVVMALWLWKFTIWNDVGSLSRIVLIRILWNFVTLLSTMMSSSSLIMVYRAPCFKELLPLDYENCLLKRRLLSKMNSFNYNSIWNLVTLLSTRMSSSFKMVNITSCLQELLSFVNDNSLFMWIWQ